MHNKSQLSTTQHNRNRQKSGSGFPLRVLDLFSGIGGFSLGLERAGMKTVAFCEVDEFCRKVLRKHWPDVPIFEDVKKLRGDDIGTIDLICGGYPCQPFSLAGQRRGQDDDRRLWPEMFRLIKELNPTWILAENVAGHINMGLDEVLSDLESQGYETGTFVIPACAIDAPHRRDRVWIVANTDSRSGNPGSERTGRETRSDINKHAAPSRPMANTNTTRLQEREVFAGGEGETRRTPTREAAERNGWWATEPDVGRVAHGVPGRVDRLKALGNAVVPQIPEIIGRAIIAAEPPQ